MAASNRSAVAVLGCALACAAAFAQEREQLPIQLKAGSLSYDSERGVVEYGAVTIEQGQIRITADRAMTTDADDFKESSWEFSGTVRISMPESALASDTAKVRFANGEIASAAVTGSPATFEQKRAEDLAQGRANRIDYDLTRGTVELAGNAWLSDGKTEINGETLVYSTANQRVVSKQEVVITIQPDDPPAEAPKPEP